MSGPPYLELSQVGLKLKGQLLALFVALFMTAMGVIVYFNLLLSAQDTQLRTEQTGRRLVDVVLKQVRPALVGPSGDNSLEQFLSKGPGPVALGLQQFKDLRQFDVFTATGQKIYGVGMVLADSSPLQLQAIEHVRATRESFTRSWAYPAHESADGYAMDNVGLFFRGWIAQEHYEPVLNRQGELLGILHFSLEIPRAALRINMTLMGNVLLACIFLISSILAFYLWGEFAINRPLKGLLEAQDRLQTLEMPASADLVPGLLSSNELANVSSSFNRLSLALVQYQGELQEKTRRLESANQQYRQLNEQLEHKVGEKTQEMKEFFSLITHDLRIPLAAVAGYVDLLQKPKTGELSEKQRKFLEHIGGANHHAQEMVRNLLEAMRYEFGQPQLSPEKFDLCALAHEIVAHLHASPETIHLQLPPQARVQADRTRIGRVLGNLLGNAVRHAKTVELRIAQVGQDWQIEVNDDGPGIPIEQLEHLFDKFKHIQAQEGSSGLGLGLYIVKRIIADHGAEIEVHSGVGEGTRFVFRLANIGD